MTYYEIKNEVDKIINWNVDKTSIMLCEIISLIIQNEWNFLLEIIPLWDDEFCKIGEAVVIEYVSINNGLFQLICCLEVDKLFRKEYQEIASKIQRDYNELNLTMCKNYILNIFPKIPHFE